MKKPSAATIAAPLSCLLATLHAPEPWHPTPGTTWQWQLQGTNGWTREKWLDIRQISILGPIMEARMDLWKLKGFDGTFLANAAHARGLSVGLKNDVDQGVQLQLYFDRALNEECFTYDECDTLKPFIAANKAVFHVEYSSSLASFCPITTVLEFSSMKKRTSLDAWRRPC